MPSPGALRIVVVPPMSASRPRTEAWTPRRPSPAASLEPAGRDPDAVVPDRDGDPLRLVLQQDPRLGVGAGVPANVVEGRADRAPQRVRHRRGDEHRVTGPGDDDVASGERRERGA